MIIRNIRMVNFRNFRDKTIDFNDKPVVLLSAANGIGKTTTIDAIEWCLTGNIGRLKEAFVNRSTNETDRKMNTDGILKNREASINEKVKVSLSLFDGEKEIHLSREQTSDELSPELSKISLDNDEKKAETFINTYVGDSFYNFHFCDIQKSFNIQNKKRKDLKDIFSEFITNYDSQKQIAENLLIFADDVDRFIVEKTNQREKKLELLNDKKTQVAEFRKNPDNLLYPKNLFYQNEILEITNLDKDTLKSQKNDLINCAYQVVREKTLKLIKNEELKDQLNILKKLNTYWNTNRKSIEFAVKEGLSRNSDKIEKIERKLNELNKLHLSKDTIFHDIENFISFDDKYKIYSEYGTDKLSIEEKKRNINKLLNEIELLTQNNRLLKILSSLSVNKQLFIEYRNNVQKSRGIAKCPICGSDQFSKIEEKMILNEADNYIKQNGELVKEKEEKKKILEIEVEAIYQKMIAQTKLIIEKEKDNAEKQIKKLKSLILEMQPYFDEVLKLKKYKPEIKEDLLSDEKIDSLLYDGESLLLTQEIEQDEEIMYQQILMLIGYDFEAETIQQTYAKMENLCKHKYEVSNFSYEVLASKINALDSVLANKELLELNQYIETKQCEIKKLDCEIDELQKLKERADKKSKAIREVVDKLSKDEYEKVGPTLNKFYNKLIRFKSNGEINLIQEKDGISLVDGKNKNIVNILSNGQINVFMLAHFFAGINSRSTNEKMKIYFIDDLTACMDDVNMLAFIDLLKYQMSNKTSMDQLFFITCDDRISNLLRYKMNGREIALCELHENDFTEM